MRSVQKDVNGIIYNIASGSIAKQASGSVVVSCGGTVVLVTATASKEPKEDMSFLPLSVEYQEKFYASGKIPGNYFRREVGRPSDKEILTARMIDRPIRPLFPEGYNFETQIIATVLSMDRRYEPDILAITGASAALSISDIPFNGPIAALNVARIDGEFVASPSIEEIEKADINIIVAASKEGVVMVEGSSNIAKEEDVIDAIYFAEEKIKLLIELQEELIAGIGKEKREIKVKEENQDIKKEIESYTPQLKEALFIKSKIERQKGIKKLQDTILENIKEENRDEAKELFSKVKKEVSRSIVLQDGVRIDGRKFDEIRQISCDIGVLPRTHGSAIFTRGETQVLGVLTLGTGDDEQRVENLLGNHTNNFMLHYNFPPYSVGECRRVMGPSRRDTGHGNLARKAVLPLLPPLENFDYTIRLVSEVLESNGSSSMATVCASSLALMDGGVPIKKPIAGIAMGLVKDENSVAILSDILGDEDHFGDMDFKVAGTEDGITAIQMDIKIEKLSKDIMEKALQQAKAGRIHILSEMSKVIDVPKSNLSEYAPKIYTIQINPDKIGALIGPGGKVIKDIQSTTNTKLEIDDKGLVKILSETDEELKAAIKRVEDITQEPEVGKIYDGTVKNITDFGAFVKIGENMEGLVHISEFSDKRISSVSDVVTEGDKIKVKLLELTRDGKLRLSYKAALEKE